jgi:hypothetical protein
MYSCIYRKTPFETASREHILQNFLGARWVSAEIVCDDVQEIFSQSIDKALELGFKEYRVLLGTEGGRGGKGPSLKVDTTEGRTMLVEPGGTAKLTEPRMTPLDDTPDSFHAEISSAIDAGWLAKKIRDLYPKIDMAGLIASLVALKSPATAPRTDPTDRLKLTVRLGGELFFRGAMKATFNLLGVNNPTLALSDIFDPVRLFILDGTGDSRTFGRWPVKKPTLLPRHGEFDHFIAVYSYAGAVEAFAQFFGAFHWTFRLAGSYSGPDFCHAYSVDPFREAVPAEDRNPNVTAQSFVAFDDGRSEQDEDVRRYGRAAAEEFLRRHLARSSRIEIEAAIQNAWGPADGHVLTKADIDRVTDAVKEIMLRRIGLSSE